MWREPHALDIVLLDEGETGCELAECGGASRRGPSVMRVLGSPPEDW